MEKMIVWSVGEWYPSKRNPSMCKTIVFKPLDSNKTYKLYLDDLFATTPKWLPYMVEGTVIDGIKLLPGYKNIIDSGSNFTVTRQVINK